MDTGRRGLPDAGSRHRSKELGMSARLWVVCVFLLVVLLMVAVPLTKHYIQVESIRIDLSRIMPDYNTLGRDRFQDRVRGICRRSGLDPDAVQIVIAEDRERDMVAVELRYVSRRRILFVPLERQVVVRDATVDLGL
jgi:hypothetical protein